jgi:hypothetical protein
VAASSDSLYESLFFAELFCLDIEGAVLSKTSKKKKSTKKKTSSAKTKSKKTTKKTKAATKKKPAAKETSAKKKPAKKEKKAPPKKKKTSAKKKRTQKVISSDVSAMLHELEVEIKSDDEQVSLGAIERLGVLKSPQATQVLIIALSDSRYIVRMHAAAQLGERQDKKSVDALIASLNDESVFVRQTIAGALENIGGTKAKKAVTKAEKDGLLLDELPEGKRLTE